IFVPFVPALAEDEWRPPLPSAPPVPAAVTDDEVIVTMPGGEGWLPPIRVLPALPKVFADDEVFVTMPGDEGWSPPPARKRDQGPIPTWILGGNEDVGPLFGQAEEFFWLPPVPPPPPIVSAVTDDEIIVFSILNVEDEYWQNPTPPVPASNLQFPHLWGAEDENPSTVQAEDYWIVLSVGIAAPKTFTAVDDEIVQPPTPTVDEDFWQNWIRPSDPGNIV